MIDTTRKGMRCRARKVIRGHAVMIEPDRRGTVAYETENLGRRLILVDWDGNSSLYVFPDEIQIAGTRERHPFDE
jgi:hypothetical protein